MSKKYLLVLYSILIIGTGLAAALIRANSDVRARSDSNLSSSLNTDLRAAAVYQAASPTPTEQAVSVAGSTDGIILMGVIIVVIILLPLLVRKSTWKK